MKKKISFIALLFIFGGTQSYAAHEQCGRYDRPSDINQCAVDNFNHEKKQLLKTLYTYSRDLAPPEKRSLEDAQLAWTSYSEKQCHFEASAALGKPIHTHVLYSCLAEFTEQRIEYIEDLRHCAHGVKPGCF